MSLLLIAVTCPDRATAERIASHLLGARLVACANIIPVASIYRWKGKVVRAKEILVFLKTTPRQARRAVREIERLHPYEVPCIERFAVSSNASCGNWIREVTAARKKRA